MYRKKSKLNIKQAEGRNNKTRAEINEIKVKKMIEKIKKNKIWFFEKI